jgi:hypothetical protein
VAGTGPEDLYDLQQELLDASVASLDTIPTFAPGLGGAPERSYVSPGLPAFDCCDQLTVHTPAILDSPFSPDSATGRSARSASVITVSLVVTATRCVPGEPEPAVVDLLAPTQQISADGWALRNHLLNMIRSDELFSICSEVFWDGLRYVNPQGGCAGWTVNLRVQLDGYESP